MSDQVLIAAIIALFGALTTVAGVAWAERGRRITDTEAQLAYYRSEVPIIMDRVINSVDALKQSNGTVVRHAHEDRLSCSIADRSTVGVGHVSSTH